MSTNTQLVKRNGQNYNQFRTSKTCDLDTFDFEFNLDELVLEGFQWDGNRFRDVEVSGIQVEDQFQYVIVDTADLQKLFVSEPVDLNLDSLKQAVEDVLQDTLTLRSDKNLGRPDILIRSYLADQIADKYVKLVNSLEE